MASWRSFSLVVALIVCVSGSAYADSAQRRAFASAAPKTGRQWLTFGFVLSPGFTHDTKGPGRGVGEFVPHFGLGYQLGLMHALSEYFYMAAEGEVGGSYVRPHTMDPGGISEDDAGFSWKLGLHGRYNVSGQTGGLTLGAGLSTFRFSLENSSLQTLNADLRAGWRIWYGFDFATIELGYALPILSGLNVSSFSEQTPIEDNWVFHRFSLSFVFGF